MGTGAIIRIFAQEAPLESSYFGLGASYAKEQTKRAMVDLISVTLQILWQRPEVLPMHSNGDAK